MSRFSGGRSLFDDSGGNDRFTGSRDLLSDGIEEEPVLERDLLSEDVEGEALARTNLIGEEEGPEPEDEGVTAFTSRIAQEDEPEEDPVQGLVDQEFSVGDSFDTRSIGVIDGEEVSIGVINERPMDELDGLDSDDLALGENVELVGPDEGGFEGFDF